MLNQGETRPFSLIIWIEGTDSNCTSDAVMLKQLVLNLKFTTSWDNTVDIIFEDTSYNSVSAYNNNHSSGTNMDYSVKALLDKHPEYSLVLNYNNTSHKIDNMKFTMQKVSADENNKQWKCSIPDNAYSDLTFMILDGANNNAKVCEWTKTPNGGSTLNRGTATTYFVDSLDDLDSRGHWHDGDIDDHGEGHDSGIVDDDDW
jgi:hypothetical protein